MWWETLGTCVERKSHYPKKQQIQIEYNESDLHCKTALANQSWCTFKGKQNTKYFLND